MKRFEAAALQLGAALRERGWRLATAESCTGGLIAAACTSVAGSSDWFERGFVSYSNAAKQDMLGIAAALIETHGAVSEAVARAMAEGALAYAQADLGVAVTGIAGPGGAVPGKPVGTVWLAIALRDPAGRITTDAALLQLAGERSEVREQTVAITLQRLLEAARP